MSNAFPDEAPAWPAQIGWSWLSAAAVGLAVEVSEVVLDGHLDLGLIGVTTLIAGAFVMPGLGGALTGLLLFWHPRLQGFGRRAALVVGLGIGGVIVGSLGGDFWLVGASVVATAGAMMAMSDHRNVALAAAVLPAALWGIAGRVDAPDWSDGGGQGRNVLLITVDAFRADRVGGHAIDTSAFDRVAAEGAQLDLAMSPIPQTGPASASVLTGVGPWQHGLWSDEGQMDASSQSMALVLRDAGWQTGAFVSSDVLAAGHGHELGFDVYEDDLAWVLGMRRTALGRALMGIAPPPRTRRAPATVERSLRWLKHAPEPWFAWVHLSDPHGPYQPPPPYDERYYRGTDRRDPARTLPVGLPAYHAQSIEGVTDTEYLVARYDGEVAYADAAVAKALVWLDQSGQSDRTAVVIAGLYGESHGEGDAWFRHDALDEVTVHVPLALRLPGRIEPGTVVRHPVELARVGPTLLDYATGEGAALSLRAEIAGQVPVDGGRARSALAGKSGRRAAVSVRGAQVRYLFMDGTTSVERAWTVQGGQEHETSVSTHAHESLRAEAQRVVESMP